MTILNRRSMFLNILLLLIAAFLISQFICLAKAEGFQIVSAPSKQIQHSDVVAMFQVDDPEILKKYCIEIVAWGNQLPWPNAGGSTNDRISLRRPVQPVFGTMA